MANEPHRHGYYLDAHFHGGPRAAMPVLRHRPLLREQNRRAGSADLANKTAKEEPSEGPSVIIQE